MAATNNPFGIPLSIRGYPPLLLVPFVGSGCAALIYEVVWLRLLQLAIGSLVFSILVIPVTCTQWGQRYLIIIPAIASLAAFWPFKEMKKEN